MASGIGIVVLIALYYLIMKLFRAAKSLPRDLAGRKLAHSEADEHLYDSVREEIESGEIRSGLWTKAEATANSTENAAVRAKYIQLRFEQLEAQGKQNKIEDVDSASEEEAYWQKQNRQLDRSELGVWTQSKSTGTEEVSAVNYYTWDEWYRLYRTEAGLANSALAENMDGTSLFDSMETESLKKAHHDNICPLKLGKQFATRFDANNFIP
jgi:hypothetical protein